MGVVDCGVLLSPFRRVDLWQRRDRHRSDGRTRIRAPGDGSPTLTNDASYPCGKLPSFLTRTGSGGRKVFAAAFLLC